MDKSACWKDVMRRAHAEIVATPVPLPKEFRRVAVVEVGPTPEGDVVSFQFPGTDFFSVSVRLSPDEGLFWKLWRDLESTEVKGEGE